MASSQNSLGVLKRLLLDHCGYGADLIVEDYCFGRGRRAGLAAFAHRPFDARSICLGAFESRAADAKAEALAQRDLGAPVLISERAGRYDVWRPGPEDVVQLQADLSFRSLRDYITEHGRELSPRVLYDAKTRARVDERARQLELFVDPGLLPFVEGRLGDRLTVAVVDAIEQLLKTFRGQLTVEDQDWVFKAVFRLLAAKVLRDKRVRGFISAKLSDIEDALRRVEKHYGSQDPLVVRGKRRGDALRAAVAGFQQLGDLRNLTTEALADVYERALISKETRKRHGTHKTPAYLVDYVVWRLADWVAEIPVDRLRVFEPACGHAPFLVATMRLLRTLDLEIPDASQFFRSRLSGIDTDSFAVEIARLSLTVADEPNPDGWHGLQLGDMYQGDVLARQAAEATVLLANPPYEAGKALDLLERTIPNLPKSAVFGVVVPSTLMFSDKKRAVRFREWLIENCQLGEVSLFPDRLFTFSDHECTVLTGRRVTANSRIAQRTRLRRVREPDREGFQTDYNFTSSRVRPQREFKSQPDERLWVPEYDNRVWEWLTSLPTLDAIATTGKGLEYEGKDKPKNAITVQAKPFPGCVEGFESPRGRWLIHEHPPIKYFNLSADVIRRPGTGTDRKPQVLLNYAPPRGKWRLKPCIDSVGRAFTSRFLSVRPCVEGVTLEYLWALCVSPLANAYAFTHLLKRDVLPRDLSRLPVPPLVSADIARITRFVRAYFEAADTPRTLTEPDGFTEKEMESRFRRIDAEVLRLYDLPASAERFLLDQFAGETRLGLPFKFTRYYPEDFRGEMPLYAYLSDSFQRFRSGQPAELPRAQEERYSQLTRKSDAGTLRPREAEQLHELQAEVDGHDYAVSLIGQSTRPRTGNRRLVQEAEVRDLSDQLASIALRARGQS